MSEEPAIYGPDIAGQQPVAREDVVLEQYKMLREEIMSLIEETRKLEVHGLGAIALLYAWLATNPISREWPWWMATALAVFAGVRTLVLFVRIGDISAYMRRIEEHWEPGDNRKLPGWERHFAKPGKNRAPLSPLNTIFWIVVIIGTVGVNISAPKPIASQTTEAQTAKKSDGGSAKNSKQE